MNKSEKLSGILNKYTIDEDRIGLSPATVFKLTAPDETLYLKYSPKIFGSTTYCVGRETEAIKWLNGKINVPRMVFDEEYQGNYYLLMTALKGVMIEECGLPASRYIEFLVKALKIIQSVDIADCPFESNIAFRLNELRYLLDNGLADTDRANWEESTDFDDPEELYAWLCQNAPQEEELVFSHGDFCGSNILLDGDELGFIDLARAGKADKWYDIAICVREIRGMFHDEKHVNYFLELLGLTPDWDRINYFTLLDELF